MTVDTDQKPAASEPGQPERFTQPPDSEINVLFCVRDAGGHVVRQGQCALDVVDLQADEPGQVVEIVPEFVDEKMAPPRWDQHRRAEYPQIADQLDALWKGGEAFEVMRARVLAVKRKHPKPQD